MSSSFEIRLQGKGKPFLWAHGLLTPMQAEDILDWFGWGKFPPSIRLVRYNARGHGSSPVSHRADDYRWQSLAADMLSLADQLGIKNFIAGGASMGASTAIYAALQAPERIEGLVLVSPPTAWESRAKQAGEYRRSAALALLLGGRGLAALAARDLRSALPSWMQPSRQEALRQTLVLWQGYSRRALWAILRGAGRSDLPPKQQLQGLAKKRTLIVAWSEDPVHPLATAEELHRLLPYSELFIARTEEQFSTIPERIGAFVEQLEVELVETGNE
ncbi:MAG: alpha/beta fold hydrolase [Anaerolineales bacterium]